jgi:hypothetical protein
MKLQVPDANDGVNNGCSRQTAAPQMPAGGKAPVAGDDVETGIDENRNIKTKRLNTRGDLPMLPAVDPRVSRVGLQLVEREIGDGERFLRALRKRRWALVCWHAGLHEHPRGQTMMTNRAGARPACPIGPEAIEFRNRSKK